MFPFRKVDVQRPPARSGSLRAHEELREETTFREREGSAQVGLGLGLRGCGSGCFRGGCRRADRHGDGGQRIDAIGAETVAAVEALQVVEDTLIDGGTDACTRQAAGGATHQAANQGAGKAADTATDRTGESPEGKADLSASDGTGSTACCPADRADEGAGFLGQVLGDDALGTTDWAIEGHGDSPDLSVTNKNPPAVQEAPGRISSRAIGRDSG